MNEQEILRRLKERTDPEALAGMARYGIQTAKAFGVGIPFLRQMAAEIGTDHALAGRLWRAGYRETRLLATLLDDPELISESQMDRWVAGCDSWDVCDGLCNNLLRKVEGAYAKAFDWALREEEFVKRAGFVLIAALAVHDKRQEDAPFEAFLEIIRRQADDDRNYVKKAVNWALRQIGKRNSRLHRKAIQTARLIGREDSKAARWIATDALRELTSENTRHRLRR